VKPGGQEQLAVPPFRQYSSLDGTVVVSAGALVVVVSAASSVVVVSTGVSVVVVSAGTSVVVVSAGTTVVVDSAGTSVVVLTSVCAEDPMELVVSGSPVTS
jgi:hypothetical protein